MSIEWELRTRAVGYRKKTKKCQLFQAEKLEIIELDPGTAINSRRYIYKRYIHQNRHKLAAYVVEQTPEKTPQTREIMVRNKKLKMI